MTTMIFTSVCCLKCCKAENLFPFFFVIFFDVRILQCNNLSLCKGAPICVCVVLPPSLLLIDNIGNLPVIFLTQNNRPQCADAHWTAQSTGQQQADHVPGLLSKEHKMIRPWNLVRFNTSKWLN